MNYNLLPSKPNLGQQDKFVRLALWCMALVTLSQIFCFGLHFSTIQYFAILAILNMVVLGLTDLHSIKANVDMWIFWLLMWLSIIVNFTDIPKEFQPIPRTIGFCLLIFAVGPFFLSPSLLVIKRYLLNILNLGLLFFTLLSFVGYVLRFLPKDNQGYYIGCIDHSMTLGAISSFTALNCLHEIIKAKSKTPRQRFFICSFVASALVTMLAASRTSIGSLGCATVAYLALTFKGRYVNAVKLVLAVVIVGFIALQFTGNVTEGVESKIEYSAYHKSAFYTRQRAWADRWNEIKHHPIFGVGAHSRRYELNAVDNFSSKGQVEAGNAWLFVFSSMGIFAFLLLCVMFFRPMTYLWFNSSPKTDGSIIFAQLCFLAVYMNAESSITAAGSFIFFYTWLIVAIAGQKNETANSTGLELLPQKSAPDTHQTQPEIDK